MSGFTYDECVTLAAREEGHRVRFTYPNGFTRQGVVTTKWRWPNEPKEAWPVNELGILLDGRYVGGELEGAIRFEVMQLNGRYAEVA